jgi:hypothetical protein
VHHRVPLNIRTTVSINGELTAHQVLVASSISKILESASHRRSSSREEASPASSSALKRAGMACMEPRTKCFEQKGRRVMRNLLRSYEWNSGILIRKQRENSRIENPLSVQLLRTTLPNLLFLAQNDGIRKFHVHPRGRPLCNTTWVEFPYFCRRLRSMRFARCLQVHQGHPEKLPKFPKDVVVGQTIKIVR